MRIAELVELNESQAQIDLLVKKYEKQIIDAWGGEKFLDMRLNVKEIDDRWSANKDLDQDEYFDQIEELLDHMNSSLSMAHEYLDIRYELPTVKMLVSKLHKELEPLRITKYLEWVIRNYIKDVRVLEDLDVIMSDISQFDRLKARLPVDQRDINKYDRRQLQTTLHNLQGQDTRSKNQIKREEIAVYRSQIKTIYDGPHGKCYIPKTQEASCFLGRGTRWCTAATQGHNYFDSYHKSGPLYVLITPSGEKLQYWCPDYDRFEMMFDIMWDHIQLMDDQDHEVRNPPAIKGLIELMIEVASADHVAAHRFFPYFIPYVTDWISEHDMDRIWKAIQTSDKKEIVRIVRQGEMAMGPDFERSDYMPMMAMRKAKALIMRHGGYDRAAH